MMVKEKTPASVKSAARAMDIVEQVSRRGAATAREISRATGIPESSLSYLLTTLVSRDWLSPSADRSYTIGPALSRLAVGNPPSLAERRAAMMRAIAGATGETASLFIRRDSDVEVVDVALSSHALRFTPQKGMRVPLHSFASGKALLSTLPQDLLDEYLATVPRARFTPYTLVDEQSLREDLKRTRDRGYALSREEHTIGVMGIGVALDGQHSLSVAIPSPRFDHLTERKVSDEVIRVVREMDSARG
ncbi:IclR family transcriptional regulator [Chelativorans sp. AA-79]|uniref:IclR family transcriptional regulator n=1 Tax=Chelativorans sp. AA-79 TaxID=3028735 RepID=UPI0023F8186F|nr:IclR family transcriptional regulator [Chelativorans sp. AA-79]WEX10529.1 IclR family transcriptional regulator [Chelativorans sp. AA-79]